LPHDHPGRFVAALGAAYRASGRHERIFDSFGHNAYPNTNAESPLTVHAGGQSLDQGDYHRLMLRLTEAFAGTGQPVPGTANVRIWYLASTSSSSTSTVSPAGSRACSGPTGRASRRSRR
jgi:hypothetical protein